MTDRDPWEQQDGESGPAWEAFVAYRDLGPARSTAKVRRSTGKDKRLLERWSAEHEWVRRVTAWDREQDRAWRVELAVERRQAAREHARVGDLLVARGVQELTEHIAHGKPSVADVVRLIEVGAKLARVSRGQPEWTYAEVDADDGYQTRLDAMTPEERLREAEDAHRELTRLLGRG